MPSFNQVVLLGHLAADPELRYTPQGVAVTGFTVASNRRFTKKDGEKSEEVTFVEVTAWSRLAEVCAEFLKKGRAVLLSGRLVQDRWEDEATGKKRSKIRIVAETVQFLSSGSKDDESSTESETPSEETAAAVAEAPAPAPAPTRTAAKSKQR